MIDSQTEISDPLVFSGFHTLAPVHPFPLTQIEMTNSFPLDSITCGTHENAVSATGDALKMIEGNSTPSPDPGILANSDDAFQKLLLRIAAKAAERADAGSLIQLFCRAAREFFQVNGVISVGLLVLVLVQLAVRKGP